MIELGPNRYGKSAIRLVKVIRHADRHEVRDLTVEVILEGDFAAAHEDGDNANVVATDTMKNTVYAFAREHLTGAVERFGHVLARHFVALNAVERATVSIDEHRWVRVPTDDGPAPDAFFRSGDFTRTAVVSATEAGTSVEAGVRDLTVMKTRKSAFTGFPRDEYTTLPEVDDRIMATMVSATWRYGDGAEPVDYDASFDAIGATLLEVFAEHQSPSVQATVWIVGRAILERHLEVDEVRMSLPNLHHWLVDLSPFGQPNDGEIFVATREPHGLIEATVRRG
ncbi:MAG: urate oxidase [Chloroflexota bacterium]|nr:urate oxidase [Chloroflexota bacterium]